ncbi:hypothetical protein CKO51_24970 [Rhodopirellula sp. SM50]|nr:hypothetical protein CKO51_24970 [Rhodopirellula sp. SM50]
MAENRYECPKSHRPLATEVNLFAPETVNVNGRTKRKRMFMKSKHSECVIAIRPLLTVCASHGVHSQPYQADDWPQRNSHFVVDEVTSPVRQ